MEEISFKRCPICGGELDTGKVQFPAPRAIFDLIDAEGKFYSDKTTEANEKHRIKKLFQTCDKSTVTEYTMNRKRLRFRINRSMADAPTNTKQTLLSSEGCRENDPMISQFLAP